MLAWLKDEPGAPIVDPMLNGGIVSAVNWSEVLQKARDDGRDPLATAELLEGLGLTIAAATRGDAILAAKLWERGTALSLADRFCISLAFRLDARAVTAERAWPSLGTGVDIVVIR